jgi:hypothetical protein
MASIGDWQSTLVTIAEWASQPANGPVLASGVVFIWLNKPLAGGLAQNHSALSLKIAKALKCNIAASEGILSPAKPRSHRLVLSSSTQSNATFAM